MDKKKWIDTYLSNYRGESVESKELSQFVKPNYKGDAYVPWAVIERLAYIQDPDLTINKMMNDEGGFVFTDKCELKQNNNGVITESVAMSHFVKCECTFLGKHFEEPFPIQDNSYESPKAYNQNLVNKSLQRCMTRLIARATGLALSLYENGKMPEDEDDIKELGKNKDSKPVIKEPEKVIEKPKDKIVKKEPLIVESNVAPVIYDIIDLLRREDKEKLNKVLQLYNNSIVKTYGFSISSEDDNDTLVTNLSKLTNPNVFYNAIVKKLGE